MTVQDDMITQLEIYMAAMVAPVDGYPVIDLDVNYSSRSPVDAQIYISSVIREEADDYPNGEVGYVLVDRNHDDASNTMGFIAINKDDNEEFEKPQTSVANAFPAPDYSRDARSSVEVCNVNGWHAYYFFVTYNGS